MLAKGSRSSPGRALLRFLLLTVLVAPVLAGCLVTATTPTLPQATVVYGPQAPETLVVPPLAPTLTPVVAGAQTPAQGASQGAGQPFTLTILHTNDVAGWMDPCG
jgi:hypothetical protein